MNTTRAQLLALRQHIDPKHAAELQAIIQQHTAEMAHLKYVASCLAAECSKYSGAMQRTPSLKLAIEGIQRSVAEVSR